MIKPNCLKKGDLIGVTAPSNPIIGDNIDEIKKAKEIIEDLGYRVEFSENLFSNKLGYSSSPEEKADDINYMFSNKDIKMIWFAKGGENSNSLFEYLDFDMISRNPKIICGYSDITSLTSIINERTGLITFSGTNFKTIATDETNYSLNEIINRFEKCNLDFGKSKIGYDTIKTGKAEGELVGGNLSLITGLVCGKYNISFKNKILFLEELGFESDPQLVNNHLHYMKQNGVFEDIKGIWLGNYTHESGIKIEKILLDVIGNDFNGPIIKSENFGHIEEKTVIPIGVKAQIDTNQEIKIKIMEKCLANT